MSDFEYLSVLTAVIVGIGIAHLLLSIGRIIGQTKRLNVGAVHLIWTFNIISLLIAYWWWGNQSQGAGGMGIPAVLFHIGQYGAVVSVSGDTLSCVHTTGI